MKKNIGTIDRVIRILIGIALIVYAVIYSNVIVGVIAIIPLATALFRWCPLYCPLNISTCGDTCDK